jgi:hypothetical protein
MRRYTVLSAIFAISFVLLATVVLFGAGSISLEEIRTAARTNPWFFRMIILLCLGGASNITMIARVMIYGWGPSKE